MGSYDWRIPGQVLALAGRPQVMGIVNVTPDSFSDGGRCYAPDAAVAHALALVEQGADLLDVGAESSRPGAVAVSVEEELRRIVPVVQRLVPQTNVPISIDTTKAAVARACLDTGAKIINDISGLTADPDMAEVARAAGAGVIVMHMQGTPATMQLDPRYDNVVAEVGRYFEARLHDLASAGIAMEQIVLDPGIGFGKRSEHNLTLLARLHEFRRFGRPICLGVSRKGFLGHLLQRPVGERLAGSLAAALYALGRQAVHVVRVHDVAATRDAVRVFEILQDLGGLR